MVARHIGEKGKIYKKTIKYAPTAHYSRQKPAGEKRGRQNSRNYLAGAAEMSGPDFTSSPSRIICGILRKS
jgi:hypothetical protein